MSDAQPEQPAASQVAQPGNPPGQDEGVAGSGPGDVVPVDTGPEVEPHDTTDQPALSKSEIKGRTTDDYGSEDGDTGADR